MRRLLRRGAVVAAIAVTGLLGATVGPASASSSATKQEIIARAESTRPADPAGSLPSDVAVSVHGAVGKIQSKRGTATLTADDAKNSVVRGQPDGVQALTVLRKGSTATYTLDLPADHMLKPDGNGGLRITDTTGAIFYGAVKAPWAVDATGSTCQRVTACEETRSSRM